MSRPLLGAQQAEEFADGMFPLSWMAHAPKYEAAARRWLGRYLVERSPTLLDFAQMAARLTERPLP